MIVVGMKTLGAEDFLEYSLNSILDFADAVIVTAGPESAKRVRSFQKAKLIKLTAIWSNTQNSIEALHTTYSATNEGDYYFWLDGYEALTNTFKKEFFDRFLTFIEKGYPIMTRTLYFYPDFQHTLHTPKLDRLSFRGCIVDHQRELNLNPVRYVKLRNPVLNYSQLSKKGVIHSYHGGHPKCIVTHQ